MWLNNNFINEKSEIVQPSNKLDKHKSTEVINNKNTKEPTKVNSEDAITQNKIMHLMQNTDSLKHKNGIGLFI